LSLCSYLTEGLEFVLAFLTIFCVNLFDLEELMEKVVVADRLQCHLVVVVVVVVVVVL
jgi:hypothetical protein